MKILDSRLNQIYVCMPECVNTDNFFGYYDKKCSWDNRVLIHISDQLSSVKKPNPNISIKLKVKNINNGESRSIGETLSYNWQQGSRLHWIKSDLVMFNIYNKELKLYECVCYNVDKLEEICRFNKPIQESYKDEYFLSINYCRLWSMRPDYCYRNIAPMTSEELSNLHNDGIWLTDFTSHETVLLHSLKEIVDCDSKKFYYNCQHNVNHLMCSPNGKKFIFIHRSYLKNRRYDRLLVSDFKNIKVLVDEDYVSHCCWVNDSIILGYMRNKGKNGFYFYDLDKDEIIPCTVMNSLCAGDGHPSCFGNLIVFDSYPDKSRMQKLFLYNIAENKVYPLIEVYQSTKFWNETRCDLHPRFSNEGDKIFFDTTFNGYRQMCYVDITPFLN